MLSCSAMRGKGGHFIETILSHTSKLTACCSTLFKAIFVPENTSPVSK